MRMQLCMPVHMHICVHVNVHMIHVHMRVCMCMCVRMHMVTSLHDRIAQRADPLHRALHLVAMLEPHGRPSSSVN